MHFERGRDFLRAAQYHHYAAEVALQRYAYREAITHFTSGLALLKTVPHSPERAQREIALCCALGTALTATNGYASIAVEQVFSRAHALWQQAGSTRPSFPICHGLWGFANVRAELPTALSLGHQLLSLARTTQDPLHLSLAHNALGATFFWQGNLRAAQHHYERGLAIKDPASSGSTDFVDDPRVLALSSLSVILSHLGDMTRAYASADKALALAQAHGHSHSLALAQCHIATLHQICRSFLAMQNTAAAGIALSTDKGFPYCLACSTTQHGWARAMQTAGGEGIEQICQGVAAYRATGAVLWQAYFLALLAEAQLIAGRTAECLQTLTEGLARAEGRGQLPPQADLYRIMGDLLLAQEGKNQKLEIPSPQSAMRNPQSEAEACFRKAIAIAKQQQARSLELRAVMSLVRLRQRQASEHGPGSAHRA